MKGSGGEIVQVEGGHIVRSTGRKDRHSKVYTSKGPRDRRVRLSAHTAIQFYDVQDRLGYDRPSKAVDWLIKKAKSAIDKLAELPPWHPVAVNDGNLDQNPGGGCNEMAIAEQSEQLGNGNSGNDHHHSSFVTETMDPDEIPDTMKSLFPTSATNSSMNFQSYPSDIISRNANYGEDLGLSLHSFQDGGHTTSNHQNLFPSSAYEALLGQDSEFCQRGTLQSSFAQSIQPWNDLTMTAPDDHRPQEIHQSFIIGSRFSPEGLAGFNFPSQIRGEEEQRVAPNRPSTSPNSQH